MYNKKKIRFSFLDAKMSYTFQKNVNHQTTVYMYHMCLTSHCCDLRAIILNGHGNDFCQKLFFRF